VCDVAGSGEGECERRAGHYAHTQLRDARWVIVDLIGTGRRVRTVPMPNWTKHTIDAWTTAAGINDGFVFRRTTKGGRVAAAGMTARSIFRMVNRGGVSIDVAKLAPHDLRRTFAKLAHKEEPPWNRSN